MRDLDGTMLWKGRDWSCPVVEVAHFYSKFCPSLRAMIIVARFTHELSRRQSTFQGTSLSQRRVFNREGVYTKSNLDHGRIAKTRTSKFAIAEESVVL